MDMQAVSREWFDPSSVCSFSALGLTCLWPRCALLWGIERDQRAGQERKPVWRLSQRRPGPPSGLTCSSGKTDRPSARSPTAS